LARASKPAKIPRSSNEKPADDSSSPKTQLVEIPHTLSVRQLADLLQVSAIDILKQLMRNGIMANINQIIGYETASAIAAAIGYETRPVPKAAQSSSSAIGEIKKPRPQDEEFGSGLKPRPAVVTIMGHVNHGKTRLLDAIRETNVMDTEAGSITQHIGAYQVKVNEQKITFLDTPGHEAFTAMRARGAQVTDITVLVVAADDGVMPQTREAIDHARAAGVPIVVAINKIDKPEVNIDMVKQQLADAGVMVEDWGGDTVFSLVSAKEKTGIPELLESILLVSEMENLRANPSKPAEGTVIEAEMDKTKGPLATVLIHTGTLRVGDTVVVGTTWGRLKAMFNDTGKQLRKAEPSTPVEILGLDSVPRVGDNLTTVANEHQARALIQKRQAKIKQQALSVNLSNLYEQISAGHIKELNVILKTDVQGSIEPIKTSLEQLGTKEVQVRVIHSGSGNITETDISLAIASKGLVIGFNTTTETGARRLADIEGISIRNYDVIYTLTDDVDKALKGMLEPSYVDVIEGRAEVRAIFTAAKKQKVAGVYVTEGKISRGASIRVKRQEKVISEPTIGSLKRFKDDVKEVNTGYECGIGFKDFNGFEVGDILEFFRREKK